MRTMDRVDLHAPGMRATPAALGRRARCRSSTPASTTCSPASRRSAARPAAPCCARQEQERSRIAQDLHDEVNQALTAILLRLEATTLRRAVRAAPGAAGDQAARHPGDGGAAAPRPPAAPDRARRPRPDPGARLAGRGLRRAHRHRRALLAPRPGARRSPTRSSSSSTASRRRACPTSPSTRGARHVDVELSFVGRTSCAITDDGYGFEPGQSGATAAARTRRRPRPLGHARARAARRRPPRPSSPRPERGPRSNSPWERS